MIAAAQIAVGPGDQERGKRIAGTRWKVGAGSVGDGAGQLAAGRVVLFAKRANPPRLLRSRIEGNAFRENAHAVFELKRVAGGGVAAHNVVVKHGLKLPALAVSQFGQMA